MTAIKKGDNIRIKNNLMQELVRCGFNEATIGGFVKRFEGKKLIALDVYEHEIFLENTETFVTVDFCCEIPLSACELINKN
jgi:hypothetical protein